MSKQHSLLSPSAASRWLVCSASVDECAGVPRVTNEAADNGTHLHTLAHDRLETILKGKGYEGLIDDAPSEIREYLKYIASTHKRELRPILESTFHQMLEFSKYQVFGTPDAIVDYGDSLEIVDLKTGRWPVEAKNNLQLLTYAWLVSQILVTPVKKITIVQHLVVDSFEITESLIEEHGRRILGVQEKLKSGKAEYVVGDHCQFCPAKHKCPKYTEDIVIFEAKPKPIDRLSVQEMENILLVKRKLLNYLEEVESRLKKRLEEGQELAHFELKPGRGRRSWAKNSDEIINELKNKENFLDYLDLKSLTAIEKFDSVFVDSNTAYVAGKATLALKKDSEFEFEKLDT